MISMSFGFPSREVDGYDLLSRSIRRAVNKDVLLFAAASNNGANTKRAYPARHPDVICIHSTNANGAPSDFNPIPLQGDNLATVGEAIESAWPVHLCDREMNKLCVARKSGTSFATPIASGVASFCTICESKVASRRSCIAEAVSLHEGCSESSLCKKSGI